LVQEMKRALAEKAAPSKETTRRGEIRCGLEKNAYWGRASRGDGEGQKFSEIKQGGDVIVLQKPGEHCIKKKKNITGKGT